MRIAFRGMKKISKFRNPSVRSSCFEERSVVMIVNGIGLI